jgi:hypothetical protein
MLQGELYDNWIGLAELGREEGYKKT